MDAVNSEALLVAGQAVSLRSLGADRLRLAIVTGRFRPGQQLRSAALRALSRAIIAGDEALADRLCTDHLKAIGAMARSIIEAGYRVPGSPD